MIRMTLQFDLLIETRVVLLIEKLSEEHIDVELDDLVEGLNGGRGLAEVEFYEFEYVETAHLDVR